MFFLAAFWPQYHGSNVADPTPIEVVAEDIKTILATVAPEGWEEKSGIAIADLDVEGVRRFPGIRFKVRPSHRTMKWC